MPKFVVYTTANCPKCKLLKEYLASTGVRFTEKNLEDSDVAAELILKDVFDLTAPILEVDGVIVPHAEIFDGNKLLVNKLTAFLRGGSRG
ncbi:TPA: NrdH-redoxin [Candidatus Micrarchaeota archaeon]|nr:NrdH-redoxin [Candidatus Micrarchaeota archaeon]